MTLNPQPAAPPESIAPKLFAFGLFAGLSGFAVFYVGRWMQPENERLQFVGAILLFFPALIALIAAIVTFAFKRLTDDFIVRCVRSGCDGWLNVRQVIKAERCPSCRHVGVLNFNKQRGELICSSCLHKFEHISLPCPKCRIDLGPKSQNWV